MKHPNDALRIAIGIGGMRIVDKELDMMDGYEFMKVVLITTKFQRYD